jgi:hypothetical protein
MVFTVTIIIITRFVLRSIFKSSPSHFAEMKLISFIISLVILDGYARQNNVFFFSHFGSDDNTGVDKRHILWCAYRAGFA